jgi:hypothetical protein
MESENITARISKEWKRRMLIIIVVTVGMGAWFLVDGLVGYPASAKRAVVYAELEEIHGAETASLDEAWKKTAVERGWPLSRPKAYTDEEIRMQFIMAGLTWAGSLAALAYFLVSLPKTTSLQGSVLHLPDGRKIPLDSIRSINKKRWNSRSICDLTSEAKPGTIQKFILDDYKYAGADEILARIEADRLEAPSNPT